MKTGGWNLWVSLKKSSVDTMFQTTTEMYFYHMPVLLRKMVQTTRDWHNERDLLQPSEFLSDLICLGVSHLLNITSDSLVVWHINRKSIAIKLQWSNLHCWKIKTEGESHGFQNNDERWQKTTAMVKGQEQLKGLHGSSLQNIISLYIHLI